MKARFWKLLRQDAGIAGCTQVSEADDEALRPSGGHRDRSPSLIPGTGAFLVGLTSVHWREAWKYGERAYRYCQHDAGHALGALCFATAALGWRVALLSALSDAEVAGLLGLDRVADFAGVEAEHPDLIAVVFTDPAVRAQRDLAAGVVAAARAGHWTGAANRLSPEHVDWPAIGAVEDAAVKPPTASVPRRGSASMFSQRSLVDAQIGWSGVNILGFSGPGE